VGVARTALLEARFRATAPLWEVAVFGFAPLLLLGIVFFAELRWGRSLGDFKIFRDAASAVIHGRTPYVAVEPHALAQSDKFVYPPITGLLFAPFALMPLEVARLVMLLAVTASIPVALRLLGVQDWRCYGLALLTAPFADALSIGALTPFLLVAAALGWRFRDRPLIGPLACAVAAVSKIFLWPLGIWLVATRRVRSAGLCAAAAAGLLLVGWAVIGFQGLDTYSHLLRVLSDVEAGKSYSLVGFFGLTGAPASATSLALGAALAGAVIAAARGENGDRRAFAVAVAGSVLVTPVLWVHYFVLLFVPLALFRPRLSPVWFAPLAFWATPFAYSDGVAWRVCVALLTAAGILVSSIVRPRLSAPTTYVATSASHP
jgi:alpha-1,2-mannosyltransferase